MYCTQCGVNNDRGESACYICGAAMPTSLAFVTDTPGRPAPRSKAAPAAEKVASVGDRTLALIFDRALLASALMVFAAWQTSTAGRIDPTGIWFFASAAGLTFLLMLLYHVILEGAFGTTLGKAMMALRVRPSGDRGRNSRPATPTAISTTASARATDDASAREQPAGPQVAVSDRVKSRSETGHRMPPARAARPSARTRPSGGG